MIVQMHIYGGGVSNGEECVSDRCYWYCNTSIIQVICSIATDVSSNGAYVELTVETNVDGFHIFKEVG